LKILIVRVSSLGDVVHNMPMLQDILQHYPQAQIDWVVEEAYVGLVRLQPGVRRIIPVALRRWRKQWWSKAVRAEIKAFRQTLAQESYDVVFDTQGLFKTGLLMRWAKLAPGGKKVGLANATEGSGYEGISRIFHDQSVSVAKRCHAVARAREVAAVALGYGRDFVQATPADFGLRQARLGQPGGTRPGWMPEQKYAVFFHGTARAAKQWPLASWIALGQMLAQKGWLILLPWGSSQEQALAQTLAQAIPGARVLPALPLLEAVQLAQTASLVIGVDTGLTHVAAAFETPTIELYCDSPRWKTECNWSERVINLGDAGQSPALPDVLAAIARLGCDVAPAV
jgi:heptosyltransferase-1